MSLTVPISTKIGTYELPKTETEADRELLRSRYLVNPNRIGVPEVDKMLAEEQTLVPSKKYTFKDLKFLVVDKEGELPKLSLFKNLKRLVFTDDCMRSNLFEVLCFLEACPLLQQLDLDMPIRQQDLDEDERQHNAEREGQNDAELEGQNSKITSRPRCSHHNLEEVNIYGFDGHPGIFQLARYLVENATVLEKMIISRKSKTYVGNGAYECSKRRARLFGMSPEKFCKLLREFAHNATQILMV